MNYIIEDFEADTTKHLSCREGDIFAWVYFKGSPFSSDSTYDVHDLWVMEPGDYVTITNRIDDLPEWLSIHPIKFAGKNIRRLREMVDYNYDATLDSSSLETVWEADVYEYLIWAGDRTSKGDESFILGIYRFRVGSVVIHNRKGKFLKDLNFLNHVVSSNNAARIHPAFKFICGQGIPREISTGWRFG